MPGSLRDRALTSPPTTAKQATIQPQTESGKEDERKSISTTALNGSILKNSAPKPTTTARAAPGQFNKFFRQGTSHKKKSITAASVSAPAMEAAIGSSKKESMLVCHEIDSRGNIHIHGGKVPKSQLCSNLGLLPRDLRKLDGTLRDQLPVILVRESSILLNIDPLRAVIKHDGVILFENHQSESRMEQVELIQNLQARLAQASVSPRAQDIVPFEFVVLETILQKCANRLQEEFDTLQPEIEETLKALEKILHWERLKILLVLKKRVNGFQERVNNFRDCLKELLESDSDMSRMYLTEKALLPSRPVQAHEEVELMLESYLKTVEEIASRIQLLSSNMQSTEDIVNIALVGQRNELLLMELRLTIGTFAASLGGFGASVLGMNLPNGLETAPHAFHLILAALLSMAGISGAMLWRRLFRLIRQN